MSFADLARRAGKFTADNSPTILTGLAVAGAVSTAYLTGKAAFRAAQILDDIETDEIQKQNPDVFFKGLTPREKIEATWTLFIPAAGAGIMTVVCIIGANHISNRRAAALAAGYAVLERGYTEYKEKVVEKLGEKKEMAARDEIAQDHIRKHPPAREMLVGISEGQVLFRDEWSGRYFESTMETVKKAQNDTNFQLFGDNYVSLNDFYQRIGLSSIAAGDEFGWNLANKVEIEFSVVLAEGERPCISISFQVEPIRGYYRLN